MLNAVKDDDFRFVKACQNGDRESFETLVHKYQNRIFNTMIRMIGDYETALDLTQEVFLRAYKNITSFKMKSTFFTWLFRIAINIATSKRRQYAQRPKNYMFSQYEVDENKGADPESEEPGPEYNLLQEEMKSTVQQAINELPLDFKQVLVLRDIEGMSYEEIQVIVQCPIGTVRSRLHRARQILKEKLTEKIQQ